MALLAACVAVAACAAALGGGCRRGTTRGEIRLADALERLALGDSAGAIASLESARWDLPRDPRVAFHYGRLLGQASDPESRARAERALRTAVESAPESGPYREALGLVLQAQGFHNDSKAELRRAVEIDPRLGRAWRALGFALVRDWRQEPENVALCDSALGCFRAALASDAQDVEARYAAACLLLFGRGAVDEARRMAAPRLLASGCDSRFKILQVAIEVRALRTREACRVLEDAVHCMLPDERSLWLGADAVIPPDSAGSWALCTPSQRDSISEAFWFEQDPTPATLENERLAEHVARRCEADFRFVPHGRRRPGHATDRGEIFLRWGPPVSAVNTVPGQTRTWFWSYAAGPGALPDFVFVDRYLNGDYVRVRRDARSDFMHKEPLEVVAQRTALDLGPEARGFRTLAARFRGERGRIAVEWAFETDEDSTAVAVRAAAWDGPRRMRGESDARRIAVARIGDRLVGRARVEVAPPASAVALEVQADAGRATARPRWRHAARTPLAVLPADPETLQVSDLLPAYALAEGDVADPRQAVRLPRADSLVAGDALHVYFEIYPSRAALRSARVLQVAYRVELRPPRWRFRDQFSAAARARREPRAVVESTFEIRARSEREPQRLSVDVRTLGEGPHVFAVTVRDPVTGTEIERQWPFAVAGRAVATD